MYMYKNNSSIFIVFKQCQGDIYQFQIQTIMIPIFYDADVNKHSESYTIWSHSVIYIYSKPRMHNYAVWYHYRYADSGIANLLKTYVKYFFYSHFIYILLLTKVVYFHGLQYTRRQYGGMLFQFLQKRECLQRYYICCGK